MASYDFRIIRPVVITDNMLTSSNVPETVAATYAGGTTYAAGDRVGLAPVDGAAQLIYESLSAGNVGNALPVPPATSTAFWRYVASVYPAYSGAVTYALGETVSSIATDSHLLYESLAAGNVGNALSDTTKWLPLGSPKVTDGTPYNSTNRWTMFDQSYTSQTTCAEEIVLVLTLGQVVNIAGFGNLTGTTIRLQNSASGFDETIRLTTHDVGDWYEYWFEDLVEEDEALFTDIPPSVAGIFTLTISALGSTAGCGVMAIGKEKLLGQTDTGMSKEINSYSRRETNSFGQTQLRRGDFMEVLNAEVHLDPGSESEVFRAMKEYRDEPLMVVGSTDFGMSIMYGWIHSWRVPCELTGGFMPVEVRGLT
jgi:hypothetical protein